MKAIETMTKDFITISPEETVQNAAKMMTDCNIGFLPVVKEDKIVGTVTDRDICVKSVAQGEDTSSAKISHCMDDNVFYCYEHEDLEDIALNMARNQVQRMIVLNEKKRLTGIISLSDIAREEPDSTVAGRTLSHISHSSAALV